MKKETIEVPKGIRFLSEWKDFSIPNYPCIIDKKIPGCGFTEYCITNSENVILCSPRKLLLENKENQHPGEILYVRNELDQDEAVDKDLEKVTRGSTKVSTRLIDTTPEEVRRKIIEDLKNKIKSYIDQCYCENKPIKILVTYDSFRLVKELLENNILSSFRIVVDEFQSIFTDSRFKSGTELEFISQLQNLEKVSFVSATPMIDEYLEQLDEFKDLPYIELDWKTQDSLRVLKPDLIIKTCRSVNEPAYEIISKYLKGEFESVNYRDELGNVQMIESREIVFYVNSVSNILGIINKCELKPEQCNILVARTPDNVLKLRRRLGKNWEIGKIPLYGQPHKMFTFCTRTVYLGADFYSTNARTVVLSDANIETLSVDISLDLPQILGRQRNDSNPWKNRAEFYYKTTKVVRSKDEFNAFINEKIKKTNDLLISYESSPDTSKGTLAGEYLKLAQTFNYKSHYVAVNQHSGKNLVPILNKLVLVAEQRAFDIQQVDYKDRFSVFNTLKSLNLVNKDDEVVKFLIAFNNLSQFTDKMKLLCETVLGKEELSVILDQVPLIYKSIYTVLGADRCRNLKYRKGKLEKELNGQRNFGFSSTTLSKAILKNFKEDKLYMRKEIKEKLKEIYSDLGSTKIPKATDLEEYFELKRCVFTVNGKREEGFKLIKRKEQ